MKMLKDELDKLNIHWWDETVNRLTLCFEHNHTRFSIADMDIIPYYAYEFHNDTDNKMIGKFFTIRQVVDYIKENVLG